MAAQKIILKEMTRSNSLVVINRDVTCFGLFNHLGALVSSIMVRSNNHTNLALWIMYYYDQSQWEHLINHFAAISIDHDSMNSFYYYYYYCHCTLEPSLIIIQTSDQSFCISSINCDKTIRLTLVHKTDTCVLILMHISSIDRVRIAWSIEPRSIALIVPRLIT